jgi:ribose/xylose/arabinose/galactoside ABC-type transport system permease subunit
MNNTVQLNNKKSIKDSLSIIIYSVLFLAIVLFLRSQLPGFFSPSSVYSILRKIASISLAAAGLTIVVIIGKCDMSFHLVGCCTGVCFCWLMVNMGIPPVIAAFLTIIFGGMWGSVTGFLVSKLKFPDVITSIAVGCIAFGFGYLFSNAAYIYLHNDFEKAIAYGTIFTVPLPIWIMLVVLAITFWIMEKTKIGRMFYSVGANPKAAYLSGINVNAITMAAFILGGCFVSFTGMFMNAEQGFASVTTTQSILTQCFTAVYIGWAIFKRPCIQGTVFGAALTSVISLGLAQMNYPYYWGNLVIAVMLVISLLISKIKYSDRTKMIPAKKEEKGVH